MARATVPSVAAPSLKVTLPVAVPVPGLATVTVAIRATDWPETEGFGVGVSAVVVDAGSTVTVKGAEELVAKLESPP